MPLKSKARNKGRTESALGLWDLIDGRRVQMERFCYPFVWGGGKVTCLMGGLVAVAPDTVGRDKLLSIVEASMGKGLRCCFCCFSRSRAALQFPFICCAAEWQSKEWLVEVRRIRRQTRALSHRGPSAQ